MIRLGLLAFLRSRKDLSKKTLIQVPSEARYLKKVASRILSELNSDEIGEGGMFDIKLCIEEALRNAMVHGNRSDKRLSVRTIYWMDGGALNVEIEDEGAGFDRKVIADPTDEPNLLKTSGRGIYLIKKLMDRVEYNEKGNKITMIKRLK